MSDLEDKIESLIKEAFPNYPIKKQHFITFRNSKLFFDFYIPVLKTFIEVQGSQHYKFSSFFHKDIFDFNSSKTRDRLKEEWCEQKGYNLVKIPYNKVDKLSKSEFKSLVVAGL